MSRACSLDGSLSDLDLMSSAFHCRMWRDDAGDVGDVGVVGVVTLSCPLHEISEPLRISNLSKNKKVLFRRKIVKAKIYF